ncbi:DoxX family protein [Nisaea sp.]|uniref:DoxX family protein n=1 Tax=Nisaea sp. TaxID=2024842 RepID=UPI00326364EA
MTIDETLPKRSLTLHIALWAAQVLLSAVFLLAGFTKLTTPMPELVAMMPWAGDASHVFVRFVGMVDLAGGLGLILPTLTRIWPRVTVFAAAGCIALLICAFSLHAYRGEYEILWVNAVMIAMSGFIIWGREWKQHL